MTKTFTGDSPRQTRLTSTTLVAGPLATMQSGLGEYITRISPEQAAQAGEVDGKFGVLNGDIVGDNAHPHLLDALTASHGAARGVIGHIFRRDYQTIVATISRLLPAIKVSKERALSAIDAHASALKRLLILQALFAAAGSPTMKKHSGWRIALVYLALFGGDWSLIAVGFQLFGLSDTPWIPGVGFTDDLHLAAASSVAALILLGHFAADPLRRIEHSLRIRNKAAKHERSALSWPAPFDWAWLAVLLGLAGCALFALSNIRATYLASQGIDANGAAFLLLQIGIFAAALALGLAHQPDPDAVEWKAKLDAAGRGAEETGNAQRGSLDTYNGEIGEHNAAVTQLGATYAQAGHHVQADRDNAAVIASLHYLRIYLLSQSGDQIAQVNILAEAHKELPEYSDDDLRSWLSGVAPLPIFPLLSTCSVEQHLADRRADVDRLRVRIDQKSIDALDLPDYEKPEQEPTYSDEMPEDKRADNGGNHADDGPDEDVTDGTIDSDGLSGIDEEKTGAGADGKSPWLFPVSTDENDVIDGESADSAGDEASA